MIITSFWIKASSAGRGITPSNTSANASAVAASLKHQEIIIAPAFAATRTAHRLQRLTRKIRVMAILKPKQREAVFRAIADPTRREILGLLRRRKHTVNELAGNFRASRPAISKQTSSLAAARRFGRDQKRRHSTNLSVECRTIARPR
jgi:hypothetical protein